MGKSGTDVAKEVCTLVCYIHYDYAYVAIVYFFKLVYSLHILLSMIALAIVHAHY
jgi:hypothetical protein